MEIVKNHVKNLNVEYELKDYKEINEYMTKLDFNGIQPGNIKDNYNLVGSRYCSIPGNIAALIKLTDTDGNRYTLYQTALTEELKKLGDDSTYSKGYKIKYWNEDGIFVSLAGPGS